MMRRKPVRVGTKASEGPVDISNKLAGHYAGNDATMTSYRGSRETLAMETIPGDAANSRALADKKRKQSDRRYKRLRSENRVPTSSTPGAYSQATQFHPSGARY